MKKLLSTFLVTAIFAQTTAFAYPYSTNGWGRRRKLNLDRKTSQKSTVAIKEVKKNLGKYGEYMKAFFDMKAGDQPPKLSTEMYNLNKVLTQSLELPSGERINLWKNNMTFLDIGFVGQPYQKTDFTIVDGDVHITLKGKKAYKHIISDVKATDIYFTDEHIYIMSEDGHLYAIDKSSFGHFYGRSPFIVSDTTWFGPAADKPQKYTIDVVKPSTRALKIEELKEAGIIPEEATEETALIGEDDIIMYDEEGRPIHVVNRAIPELQHYNDSANWLVLHMRENPALFNSKTMRILNEFQSISEDTLKGIKTDLKDPQLQAAQSDPEVRLAAQSMDNNAVMKLYENSKVLGESPKPRKVLNLKIWQANNDIYFNEVEKKEAWLKTNNTKFKRVMAKMRENATDKMAKRFKKLSRDIRGMFTKEGRSKALTRLGRAAGDVAGLAGVSLTVVGADVMTGGMVGDGLGYMLNHGVDAWNWITTNMLHGAYAKWPILEYPDMAFRNVRVAAILASTYGIYVAGLAISGAVSKQGFIFTYMSLSLRSFARLLYPVVHGIAKASNQLNFVPAILAGLHPAFSKIEADPHIPKWGPMKLKVKASFNMFNSPTATPQQLATKRLALEKEIRIKRNTYAYAWLSAHAYIMDQHNLTPEQLMGFKLSQTSDVRERTRIMVLAESLKKIAGKYTAESFGEDLKTLSKEELSGLFDEAIAINAKIEKQNPGIEALRVGVAQMKNFFATENPMFWGNYAFSTSRALKYAMPGAEGPYSFSQQSSDMIPMSFITALDGDLAKPGNPEMLMYQEGGFLNIQPEYMADFAMQLGGYAIAHPANSYLSLNQGAQPDPKAALNVIEDKLRRLGYPQEKINGMMVENMTFGRSVGALVQQAFRFDQVQYGRKFIMKAFLAKLKAWQAFAIIGTTMMIASLSIGVELGAHNFDQTATYMGDLANAIGAPEGVSQFFSRSYQSFLARQWADAWKFFYYAWAWIPIGATLITYQNRMKKIAEGYLSRLAQLGRAVDLKSKQLVNEAGDNLRGFFKKQEKELPEYIASNKSFDVETGEAFFKYASENSGKFVKKINGKVMTMLTLFGSYITTVLGSYMVDPMYNAERFQGIIGTYERSFTGMAMAYGESGLVQVGIMVVLDEILGGGHLSKALFSANNKWLAPAVNKANVYISAKVEKAYTKTWDAMGTAKQSVVGPCNNFFKNYILMRKLRK